MPPFELPEAERTLNDTDASLKAKEKRAVTGDDFYKGLFERPFTSNEMAYLEDVDIRVVTFTKDDAFYYFAIELHGVDPEAKKLTASYGIEFDRTKTGQGDLLVWVSDVKKEWSMEGVMAFSDTDKSVGGPTPLWADKEYDKMGYDKEERLEGERVAYARIDPKDETIVQIAISKALLDFPKEFLWGAWADKGWRDPLVSITRPNPGAAAGLRSRLQVLPVKETGNLDNTAACRRFHHQDNNTLHVRLPIMQASHYLRYPAPVKPVSQPKSYAHNPINNN